RSGFEFIVVTMSDQAAVDLDAGGGRLFRRRVRGLCVRYPNTEQRQGRHQPEQSSADGSPSGAATQKTPALTGHCVTLSRVGAGTDGANTAKVAQSFVHFAGTSKSP